MGSLVIPEQCSALRAMLAVSLSRPYASIASLGSGTLWLAKHLRVARLETRAAAAAPGLSRPRVRGHPTQPKSSRAAQALREDDKAWAIEHFRIRYGPGVCWGKIRRSNHKQPRTNTAGCAPDVNPPLGTMSCKSSTTRFAEPTTRRQTARDLARNCTGIAGMHMPELRGEYVRSESGGRPGHGAVVTVASLLEG